MGRDDAVLSRSTIAYASAQSDPMKRVPDFSFWCDGSFVRESKEAATGEILKSAPGSIVHGFQEKKKLRASSPSLCEALAIQEACIFVVLADQSF